MSLLKLFRRIAFVLLASGCAMAIIVLLLGWTGLPTESAQAPSNTPSIFDSRLAAAPILQVTVNPLTLPSGVVGNPYSAALSASGKFPPFTNWAETGPLPPGLNLDPATGVISGRPTTVGGSPFNFNVTVKDSLGNMSDLQPFSIPISPTGTVFCTSISVALEPSGPTFQNTGQLLTGALSGPFQYPIVVSPANCTWNILNDFPSWLTISSPLSGTGNGTLSYSAPSNTTPNFRSALLTIYGALSTSGISAHYSVYQNSIQCSFQMSTPVPAGIVLAAGGTAAVTVTTQSDCEWAIGFSAPWLTISEPNTTGTAPFSFTAQPNPGAARQVVLGLYGGVSDPSVTVTQAGAAPATISVSPSTLAPFSYQLGGAAPAAQNISASTANPSSGISVFVSTGSGCGWVKQPIPTTGGSDSLAPYNATISVNTSFAAGLTAGSYTCPITFSAPGIASPVTVQASLTVTSATTINAIPSTLPPFSYQLGGAAPAAQNISISSTNPSGGLSVAPSLGSGCGWLNLDSANGSTPFSRSASVNTAGLTAGRYSCTITFTAAGIASPVTVLASLTVTSATTTMNAGPSSLPPFSYQLGGAATAAQTISVTSTNPGSGLSVTSSLGSGCGWLNVSPVSSSTPISMNASVNTSFASGLTAGPYTCTITFSASGVPSQTVVASLNVTTPSIPPVQNVVITQNNNGAAINQTNLGVQFGQAAAVESTVTLMATFALHSSVTNWPANSMDPASGFPGGQNNTNSWTQQFSLPAGQTQAASVVFGLGTVAGVWTFTVTDINPGGPPNPASSFTLTVAPAAPVITTGPNIVFTSNTKFIVQLSGYATTREVTSATFAFTPAGGAQLGGTSVPPVAFDVQDPSYWFNTPTSLPTGGTFGLKVPFVYTGDPNALGSVSVFLTNSKGSSATLTGTK